MNHIDITTNILIRYFSFLVASHLSMNSNVISSPTTHPPILRTRYQYKVLSCLSSYISYYTISLPPRYSAFSLLFLSLNARLPPPLSSFLFPLSSFFHNRFLGSPNLFLHSSSFLITHVERTILTNCNFSSVHLSSAQHRCAPKVKQKGRGGEGVILTIVRHVLSKDCSISM